tara:strand:+ start:333 stop:719 length:387 start_codon:yes stop_codon:yes gene_type:complete
MKKRFLIFSLPLIVFISLFLQSCNEGKVEVELSVYGPADCGISSQIMDNKTELKIWAFEKKGDCSAEGSVTINFTDTDNLTSIHLLSMSIPRNGHDVQTLEIQKNCSAFVLSQQDFKASKCIAGIKGK